MISFLINKNLCFYQWLRRKIGKKTSLSVAIHVEKGIIKLFGREKTR